LVLDADALNLLAHDQNLQTQISQRQAPTLITPHAAEAARLLGTDTQAVCQQRINTAQTLATQLNSHVVLKGAAASAPRPTGPWYINTSATPAWPAPALAMSWRDDRRILGEGLNARDALLLGVYLHGAAADELAAQGTGPIGLTASEVIDAARRLLNQWVYSV